MGTLDNKTAVITGGTRGFGLAIAQAFLAQGANVVIASRSLKGVEQALSILKAGTHAKGLACDVASLEQVQALSDFAIQAYGNLDIWVNNAGTAGPYGPTLGMRPEDFKQVVDTNIIGTYHGSITALKHFLPRKQGKLINILGRGWDGPSPFQNAYAPSKAWMRSFTLALAEEYKNSGINIFALNPGMMLTDLLLDVTVIRGHEDKLKNFPKIIRILARPPEEPAAEVARLASTATDHETGKLINTTPPVSTLWRFLSFGLRSLFSKKEEPLDLKMHTIPPYFE
jgi:NAD(P)-dependent dehydrogenase (short-subunit alcohol dehydrogenase family)